MPPAQRSKGALPHRSRPPDDLPIRPTRRVVSILMSNISRTGISSIILRTTIHRHIIVRGTDPDSLSGSIGTPMIPGTITHPMSRAGTIRIRDTATMGTVPDMATVTDTVTDITVGTVRVHTTVRPGHSVIRGQLLRTAPLALHTRRFGRTRRRCRQEAPPAQPAPR